MHLLHYHRYALSNDLYFSKVKQVTFLKAEGEEGEEGGWGRGEEGEEWGNGFSFKYNQ